MIQFLENKKVRIALIAIVVLILAGVVLSIALNGDRDTTDKEPAGQDVIVHEKEENAKEEIGEGGLIESDSEDGPVLKEENIIDYSGDDGEKDSIKDDSGKDDFEQEDSDKDASNKEHSNDDNSDKGDPDKDEDTQDTGSWGAFY